MITVAPGGSQGSLWREVLGCKWGFLGSGWLLKHNHARLYSFISDPLHCADAVQWSEHLNVSLDCRCPEQEQHPSCLFSPQCPDEYIHNKTRQMMAVQWKTWLLQKSNAWKLKAKWTPIHPLPQQILGEHTLCPSTSQGTGDKIQGEQKRQSWLSKRSRAWTGQGQITTSLDSHIKINSRCRFQHYNTCKCHDRDPEAVGTLYLGRMGNGI